nr:unnamed protein product [Callosobruchus chinensis]
MTSYSVHKGLRFRVTCRYDGTLTLPHKTDAYIGRDLTYRHLSSAIRSGITVWLTALNKLENLCTLGTTSEICQIENYQKD